MNRQQFSVLEVVHQLLALGIRPGGVLLVHTSFRAVRPIENGPAGLIEALRTALGPNGTLVMPSWTGDDDNPFDPALTPSAGDLGVVADTFWRIPGVMRSDHPQAFAAAGLQAGYITSAPLVLPPSDAGSCTSRVHELDGQILLLGVGHEANTMLHYAELVAGVPYRVPKHCTVIRDGKRHRIDYGENDHCCQMFSLADDWLRSRRLQREGAVGHAHARLMGASDIVAITVEELRRDPLMFLHPSDSGCAECDQARGSCA